MNKAFAMTCAKNASEKMLWGHPPLNSHSAYMKLYRLVVAEKIWLILGEIKYLIFIWRNCSLFSIIRV